MHQNKQGFEGKKLSGNEFLAFEEYQIVLCVEDMAGSANCTQRFSILFSYLDFSFLSSRILQNNLLHLYLVKIRRYKLSFFAKPATNSLPRFSVFKKLKLITQRGLGLAKSICAPIWRLPEVTQSLANIFRYRSWSSHIYTTGRQFMSLAAYASET